MSKGISGVTACLHLLSTCNHRTDGKSPVDMKVMATSTYGDLHPGSKREDMIMQNLSVWEVRVPPKTVIGNVQMVEIVPNMKAFKLTSKVLPSREQKNCQSSASLPTQITLK